MQQKPARPNQNVEQFNQDRLVEILKERFEGFNEVWIVGHKGDHANNLIDLGIVNRISVVHTHSTLGVNADVVVPPPTESASSYAGLLEGVSEEMREQIRRVKQLGMRIAVLMPFPNQGFQRMIQEEGAEENFILTPPVADQVLFENADNKLWFADMMEEVAVGDLESSKIQWTMVSPNQSLESIRSNLGIPYGHPVYLQISVSAGGDGTAKVTSQENLESLLADDTWAQAVLDGFVKATVGVVGPPDGNREFTEPYPANGGICIVPNSDGTCRVYVDPLSHKPVGLAELNGKATAGVGNDWGTPFHPEIQRQYIAIATAIGEYLFKLGYTGLLGVDCIVGVENGRLVLKVNELNARWQGTTPYQTLNAQANGRLPLELIHYLVKLANDDPYALEALPEPNEYNERSVNEGGGFYIKVGGPKERRVVAQDVNGPWIWDRRSKQMTRPSTNGFNATDVYTGRHGLELGEDQVVVWAKGPTPGKEVGGELAPIGYIVGKGIEVFDSIRPAVSPDGQQMYERVIDMMFAKES